MGIERLSTENIETDCTAKTVTYETYAAFESWVTLEEEGVYSIHFEGDCSDYTFAELGGIVE